MNGKYLLLLLLLTWFNLYDGKDCPNNCMNVWDQGECNQDTGECQCNPMYEGEDCSRPLSANDTWDYIDCYNGGRYFPPQQFYAGRRYCICPPGYHGMDCASCGSSSVCGGNLTCDQSIFLYKQKHYNCSVTNLKAMPVFSYDYMLITAHLNFTDPNDGRCVIDAWLEPTGPPRFFSCNFTKCTKTDFSDGTQTVSCADSDCHCWSWCNSIVATVVNSITGSMSLKCEEATNTCTFSQETLDQLGPSLQLECSAGECREQDIHVDYKTDVNYQLWAAVAAATVLVLIFLFFVIYNYVLHLIKCRKPTFEDGPEQVMLTFRNLCCSVLIGSGRNSNTEKVIFRNLSGTIQPGKITAIMGASGAGKTTFIDILAGRKNTGKVTGEVLVNGEPFSARSFSRVSGYVTQDDVFLGTLTVREHLLYVAELRLPPYINKAQREERVDNALRDLDITRIANSKIGTETSRGISGGERKRLNIAAELVVDPMVLFLDEPTSGLDSHSASALVDTLWKLAHSSKKRTIVMSIHQPRSDIYSKFDQLMLLAHGKMVYLGPAADTLSFFSMFGLECPAQYNPADFFIDTISDRDKISSMTSEEKIYPSLQSGAPTNMDEGLNDYDDDYASSFLTQFSVLTRRTMKHSLRNPFLLRMQYVVTIGLGLLLGFLYHHVPLNMSGGGLQNRMGVFFFITALLSFASITSVDLFFSERLLFLRERANGSYSTMAYFLSKAASDLLPMRVLPPIIMCSICYFLIGLNPAFIHFFYFVYAAVMTALTATAMCFAISSVVPAVSVGNLVAVLLLFFFLLFDGFLVKLDSMPVIVRWIPQLSFMTYGFAIMMINEFQGINIVVDLNGNNVDTVAGGVILVESGINANFFMLDVFVLFGMFVAYMVLAFILLRYVVKERR